MGGFQARRRRARESVKAFDEPRDLRRKPSGTRKKTPKSAPKYRTERRTSPDRRASVKPRSATARSFVAHGNKGLSHTSKTVDISETRLLRTSKERVAGDARVAVEISLAASGRNKRNKRIGLDNKRRNRSPPPQSGGSPRRPDGPTAVDAADATRMSPTGSAAC